MWELEFVVFVEQGLESRLLAPISTVQVGTRRQDFLMQAGRETTNAVHIASVRPTDVSTPSLRDSFLVSILGGHLDAMLPCRGAGDHPEPNICLKCGDTSRTNQIVRIDHTYAVHNGFEESQHRTAEEPIQFPTKTRS